MATPGSKGVDGENAEERKSAAPSSKIYGKAVSLQNKQPTLKLDKTKMHRVILWMRNDLRIHDNPVLHWAAQ